MTGNLEKKLLGKMEIEKKEYVRPEIINQFNEPIEIVPEAFEKNAYIPTLITPSGPTIKEYHYSPPKGKNGCFYPGKRTVHYCGGEDQHLNEYIIAQLANGEEEYHLQSDFQYKKIPIGINIIYRAREEKSSAKKIARDESPELTVELKKKEVKVLYTPDTRIGIFENIITKKINEKKELHKLFNINHNGIKLEMHFIGYIREEKKKEGSHSSRGK